MFGIDLVCTPVVVSMNFLYSQKLKTKFSEAEKFSQNIIQMFRTLPIVAKYRIGYFFTDLTLNHF